MPTEFLFSYGTLQQADVQQSTFGRRLEGRADALPGYKSELLEIVDPQVIATSGKTHHPIVMFSGDASDQVAGTVFAVSTGDLAHCDTYEVADYKRERVTLASGIKAWVYVDARVRSRG